jgi:hypothetical protein
MAMHEIKSRRMYILVMVMSLLFIYTFLKTSTKVSSPSSLLERHVEVPLPPQPPSHSQEEIAQQGGRIPVQNQTGEREVPGIIKTHYSSSVAENANISITTRILQKNHSKAKFHETSTIQSTSQGVNATTKMVKVKDLYEPGFSHAKPELCLMEGIDVKLLIIIMSAPSHFNHRKAIRLTWGHYTLRNDVAIAFLIGKNEDDVKKEMESEMHLYDDILLANFNDSYKNLTLKTMAMLEWTSSYCSKADYLLKADDDVFINVENLLKFIEKIEGDGNMKEPKFYGYLAEGWPPIRYESSKYFLPFEQFSENTFPDFLTGPAYLFSTVIVQSFFEKGLESKFLQLEDVFMTGVIAEAMNVTRVRVAEFQNIAINVENTSRCELSNYISIHMIGYHEQFAIWRKTLDGKSEC